jgi:CheY-like chemotaxis protein
MYLNQYNPITSSIDLQIIVEDSGIGIHEEDKQKVFLPFVQQSGQSTRKYGGTGLGLAITQQLIKMMNGEIRLESDVNKGSKFIIELKKIIVSSVKESKFSVINTNYEFEPADILLVDDIELNRTLLKELFADSNLNFLDAVDGFDAIAKAKEFLPDLIVMDIKMPRMDGVDATTYLKNDPQTKHIPIIALTASAIRSEQEHYQKLGFDVVLIKPVEKQVITDAFRKYLKYKDIASVNHSEIYLDKQDNNDLHFHDKSETVKLNADEIIYLNDKIINRAETLRNNLIISEVKIFADEVRAFGEKNNIAIMTELSNKVSEYASRFQLEQLKQTLHKIEQLNHKIF